MFEVDAWDRECVVKARLRCITNDESGVDHVPGAVTLHRGFYKPLIKALTRLIRAPRRRGPLRADGREYTFRHPKPVESTL